MEITRRTKNDYTIFGIKGSLDMNNVKYIKKVFEDELKKSVVHIAIDMRELNYIDSSGIGSFIGLMTRLKALGGQVVLVNMRDDIERIFSMTKLLAFFKVFKTEEEFYNSLSTPEGGPVNKGTATDPEDSGNMQGGFY
ncbi:MAG: STAS domain-containing protein [Spirochaetes bacterium]|nr:STAS domain-containing protein [Spirochaetota bacterium]